MDMNDDVHRRMEISRVNGRRFNENKVSNYLTVSSPAACHPTVHKKMGSAIIVFDNGPNILSLEQQNLSSHRAPV